MMAGCRRTGLTLGKFAPLHAGHQNLIETALGQVDRLVVVIYDAPESTVPLPRRAGWIRQLYPEVEVLEAWGGPTEVGYTPIIQQQHEDYLLERLADREISHFFSSEPYGEHVSAALGAVDCRVDPERREVPVRGREIRRHPYRWRSYLHPVVYRDYVTKAVCLGGPSTGKSTLAQALAEHFSTTWLPEHGREYWHRHQVDRRLSPEHLVVLAEGHLAREDEMLLEADRFLFVDTNAVTTCQYSILWHGDAPDRLRQLAAEAVKGYDLVILCGDEMPYEDTWDRSGEGERSVLQAMNRAFLRAQRVPYLEVKGPLETRVQQVADFLTHWTKFGDLQLREMVGNGTLSPETSGDI